PPNRGMNYFYGGPAAAISTGTQVITVPTGGIATGRVGYVLSGWLGGYSDQGDDATLMASFEGPDGSVLTKAQIGPVTQAQRNGISEFLFRQSSGPVPAGTQKVSVELLMPRYNGSDNDGLADNLSLAFSPLAAGATTTTTGGPGTTVAAGGGGAPGGPQGVQFSPAMVVVPAAVVASALKSGSPDGTTYNFASAVGPLARLRSGSVMVLEGVAVRKVTGVTKAPPGLVVTTSPAAITDLVTSGTISWDAPIDFADASAVQGPGVQTEGAVLPAPAAGYQTAAAALQFHRSPKAAFIGIGGKGVTLKGKAGSYSYSLSFKQQGRAASLSITLSKSSPVEVSATASGTLQNFTTEGAINVQKARVGKADVSMNGLSGDFTLSYELKPLTAFGLGAAGGFKLTIPAEITVPFAIPAPPPVGAIPMFLGLKTAFFVSVGFSNKNQSIKGSYTVHYDGDAGFSVSKAGATTGSGIIKGIGQVILDQANAIMNGPITLVLGAQIPQIELGLGGEGLNIAGFVDLVADTAIKVGGGFGGSTGCDARDLNVLATAGAKAAFFGLSAELGSTTLFNKHFVAAYPPGCGTVR
ncbi:MAG TPA: hypothetical protein VED59_09865, partial [Acidimicrobiales bacterium]|nr:hypothetical protein [Acidimicrobiales bacterium]